MKNWKNLLLAAMMLVPAYGQEADIPVTADELLADMREMTVSQGNKDVAGRIRKAKIKIPFSLSVRGDTLAFQYKDGSVWKRFDVLIKEKNVDIALVENSKARILSPTQYSQTIAGTDVCYEDLSLRFLYWKGGQMVDAGADSRIKGRDCYVVQVPNPNPAVGQFAWVRMWIDKENGTTFEEALADIEALFGLKAEGEEGDKLVLTAYELDQLRMAFEKSINGTETGVDAQAEYVMYGTYDPLSVTLTHILNNKSGISFTSYSHTGLPVAVLAEGVNAEVFNGYYDNTDIFNKLAEMLNVQ